ncbi:6-phosphogluconolactonase [[Enterobacter] lignolyticus]|uniref:Glucosamine/galactosamine-6-phosphate isomerase n=1 Tax=Enterobacter lignolyticus (strain SCF1) TaxID=701347 RepID=E3G2C2_ENTLS|nr:6-phosphogluconolactonase [[Enterobacter] lignolyticus]ADO50339.1 glucosamine/galactosamine-6-phosphate isomerase [[Enterobacter] lignolyticus SCF1]
MQLVQLTTQDDVAAHVAQQIAETITAKETASFILASGGTPTKAFDMVPSMLSQPASKAKVIKLDEWVGLSKSNENSCEQYLDEHVVKPWGITPENYIAFDGGVAPEAEVERIQNAMAAVQSPDLCIIGLGMNGHIGFIEPNDGLPVNVSKVDLHVASQSHPMVSGKHDVKFGISLGLQEIMSAKKVILMVTGEHKKEIFDKLLKSKITTSLPASLVKIHPNAEIVFSEDVL